MLKQRVIAVLPILNGTVVQSLGFQKYLPVGKPAVAVEHLNRWGIDEIVMLDISPSRPVDDGPERYVSDVAPYCLVPLAVGGGIRTIDHVRDVIKSGADRIVLNTSIFDNPLLTVQAARRFGTQCIVAAIDAKPGEGGSYDTYVDGGARRTGLSPVAMARRAEDQGAGEILIQSMHRDGCRLGYDLELSAQVAEAVSVPVVVLGGVGMPAHMAAAAEIPGVCGLAAGNFFHYTEHAPATAKAILRVAGVELRHDSHADYRECSFDAQGRLNKKADADLEELLFVHYVDEVI
jgi:cyclase